MKKLISIFCIVILAFILCSCNLDINIGSSGGQASSSQTSSSQSTNTGGTDEEPPVITAESITKKVNDLLNQTYGSLKIAVSTSYNGLKLNDLFELSFAENGTTVSYTVMRANEITIPDDGTVTIPDSQYTTTHGTVLIDGNTVTLISGEMCDVDFANLTSPKFLFATDNLQNITVTETTLNADVINSTMLNPSLAYSNCYVSVTFNSNLNIFIRGTMSSGAQVELTYTYNQ